VLALLRGLPPGEYRFADCLDDDGNGGGPLWIRVAVTVARQRLTIDFAGTDVQADGPVNANLAVTQSAIYYVLRCLLDSEAPATSGILRPVRVIAPEGTLVNATMPAAMAAGNVETSQRITDVLLGALSQAAPERIPAASSGTMNNLTFGGTDPNTGRRFAWYETIAGGMGASAAANGQSAVHTHMTNSWNTPVEAFEHAYPVRVRQYRVRRGSGGAGKRRGGDGIVRELEFLCPADVTVLADRRTHCPYGLSGGEPGEAGKTIYRRGSKDTELKGKVRFSVMSGDCIRVETPGGGGFGLE
jgi:N-methylhydantoinase B